MDPASATSKPNDVKAKNKKHTSRASSTSKPDSESPVSELNGTEPTYLKELQKSLRNALKKLNATAKVDAILAENPGKSLDALVEEKKINTDQKAQALKKPALQAQIAQLEEQLGYYKQFAAQYEERLASQKAALEKAHLEELEAVRGNVVADATETTTRVLRERLLTLSQFLCAAATLRRSGDAETLESRAFESVLFQVYGGNEDAVTAMLKLIEGSDEKLLAVEGDTLELTYGDVKQASNKLLPAEQTAQVVTETAPATDPTLAHAGLTELQDTSVGARTTTTEIAPSALSQADQVAPPAQTLVSDAANQVAEASYGPTSMISSATTDGWVEVPRDPAETETGLQATPANLDNNNGTAIQANGQNGGRGRGGRGGRGGGEGFRGRGRGDFRGRGRGGRGGRGRGGPNGHSAVTPAPQE